MPQQPLGTHATRDSCTTYRDQVAPCTRKTKQARHGHGATFTRMAQGQKGFASAGAFYFLACCRCRWLCDTGESHPMPMLSHSPRSNGEYCRCDPDIFMHYAEERVLQRIQRQRWCYSRMSWLTSSAMRASAAIPCSGRR